MKRDLRPLAVVLGGSWLLALGGCAHDASTSAMLAGNRPKMQSTSLQQTLNELQYAYPVDEAEMPIPTLKLVTTLTYSAAVQRAEQLVHAESGAAREDSSVNFDPTAAHNILAFLPKTSVQSCVKQLCALNACPGEDAIMPRIAAKTAPGIPQATWFNIDIRRPSPGKKKLRTSP